MDQKNTISNKPKLEKVKADYLSIRDGLVKVALAEREAAPVIAEPEEAVVVASTEPEAVVEEEPAAAVEEEPVVAAETADIGIDAPEVRNVAELCLGKAIHSSH